MGTMRRRNWSWDLLASRLWWLKRSLNPILEHLARESEADVFDVSDERELLNLGTEGQATCGSQTVFVKRLREFVVNLERVESEVLATDLSLLDVGAGDNLGQLLEQMQELVSW